MYFGIIAEGRSDVAVIENVLQGRLAIDRSSDIQHLQPEFELDETDRHTLSPEEHSNWLLVRDACIEKRKFSDFFSVDEERYIVIHIDTAEAEETGFDIEKPPKSGNPDYSRILRETVIDKIKEWLDNAYEESLFYAVAIEEIEAWVLTIYTDRDEDTSRSNDPKTKLNRVLNRKLSRKQKNILRGQTFKKFDTLSKEFRKKKKLREFSSLNESLMLFCDSLEELD